LRLKTIVLGLHHLGMRSFAFLAVALLSIIDLAELHAAEAQVRPALIANGPRALINMIDTKKLMEKGQRNGLLSFECFVTNAGEPVNAVTYRATPGSEVLEKEVMSALNRCRFIPAIYNGKPTEVLVHGTALFVVVDGKPHLRIYANQNPDDISKGNDFIAPQLIAGTTKALPQDELAKGRIYHEKGVVRLVIAVDANGNQKSVRVLSEEPGGFNFGHATLIMLQGAKYIPGFRNGRRVDCTFECHHWFWLVSRSR
jgi:Gram-negative bacterial TonB protein C-terminal